MKFIKKKKNINSKRGFTLFVAIIVSSMLLAIGLSLGNIALKQVIFSSTGKESQVAFYAADSGAECALYWDRKDMSGNTTYEGAFASTTLENLPDSDINPQDILCGFGGNAANGKVGGFSKISNGEGETVTTFYIDYTQPGDSGQDPACAMVTVTKTVIEESGQEGTTIDSRGYNAPFTGNVGFNPDAPTDGQCDLTNPRVVERAIILNY